MAQDKLQRAKEQWQDATEHMREQHARMVEDFRFSNPAEPRQWDDVALRLRKGRPCLTFDRTNQFVMQVVNDARQNKPSINCMPADSNADVEVAQKLNGMIRHIEYVSRAGIAYDTAIEHAARVGLGWLRVVPEIMRPETNEQEIRIKRIHDPLSIKLDPNSTEPDGSDAMFGFVETTMTNEAFKARYRKAKMASWDSEGWFQDDSIRVCEQFYVKETMQSRIVASIAGQRMTMTEDEYWQIASATGVKPQYIDNTEIALREVKWCHMSGVEILEESDFPSQYVPLIPVMGYEVWIEGKRYLCGMTRRLMDGQRAYNYERSAFIEAVALQPKAPFMIDHRAVEGFEDDWKRLNTGNPAYLVYNGLDDKGNQLPAPARLNPPAFPVAFAQGGQLATQDMEASLGMFDANLGNQGTAVSGKAKLADQRRGDTANFHYIDNLSRSIEQLGRVIVDMIPRIYDTQRQARIIGEDGEQDFVEISPEMGAAARKDGRKVVAINPSVGAYDVRVKVGPSYTTLRQESAEQLSGMLQAAPQLLPLLGDVWVKMQDWPEAEKVAKRLKAMLPPQIQQMESEEGPEIPPEVMGQMQAMQEQLAQLQQVIQQQGAELQKAQVDAEAAKLDAKRASIATAQANLQKESVQAQKQISEQIAAAQPTPEAPVADTSQLDAIAEQIKDEATAVKHERDLLEKDKKIAILEIKLLEKAMQPQEQPIAQDASEEPQEPPEPIEFLRDEAGTLLGARRGAKTFNLVRDPQSGLALSAIEA